jgi:hypothetical protein
MGAWSGLKQSQPADGLFYRPVCAIAPTPTRIDVFGDRGGSTLFHQWWDGTQSNSEDLGGSIFSPVCATSWVQSPRLGGPKPYRIDVFALDVHSALIHNSQQQGQAWTGWNSLGGVYTSPPSAVSWGPGRIDVFMLGQNHALFHNGNFGNSEGNFNGEDSRGGQNLISQPAAVSSAPGRLDVFVIGPNTPIDDCNLWHDSWI